MFCCSEPSFRLHFLGLGCSLCCSFPLFLENGDSFSPLFFRFLVCLPGFAVVWICIGLGFGRSFCVTCCLLQFYHACVCPSRDVTLPRTSRMIRLWYMERYPPTSLTNDLKVRALLLQACVSLSFAFWTPYFSEKYLIVIIFKFQSYSEFEKKNAHF